MTIAVELLIALLFSFRNKKLLFFIAAVNLVTQIALNISLNLVSYNLGQTMFIFAYALLELLIIILEANLYTAFLQKYGSTPIPKQKTITYALVANAASFIVGLSLIYIIPGIF